MLPAINTLIVFETFAQTVLSATQIQAVQPVPNATDMEGNITIDTFDETECTNVSHL